MCPKVYVAADVGLDLLEPEEWFDLHTQAFVESLPEVFWPECADWGSQDFVDICAITVLRDYR